LIIKEGWKMELKEEKEKVLVPVRRRENITKNEVPEIPQETGDVKLPQIPLRWRINK